MSVIHPQTALIAFFVTWAALAVGLTLFSYTAPIPLRRQLQAPIAIGAGILFLLFAQLISGAGLALYLIVPVALITWLNIRQTRICAACGRTDVERDPWRKREPKPCPKCGAPLDA